MELGEILYNGRSYATITLMGMTFAENALALALFTEDCNYRDSIAKMIDESICHYTDLVCESLSEADFINGLLKEDRDYFCDKFDSYAVRICDACGKVMQEGYYFEGGGYYACSEECLLKLYDGDKEAMEADRDKFDTPEEVFFYTEWESPFYD